MTSVCFYLLDDLATSDWLPFVCQLIAEQADQRRRLAVRAQSREQAEALDELLWQRPPDSFIPHNLVGEGPAQGTPVLLGWSQPLHQYQGRRQVLINLRADLPERPEQFQHIIDFVPVSKTERNQARDRYRNYRQQGMSLETLPARLTD